MIKKEGSVNFWVDPEKNKKAFTEGTNYNWIDFKLNEENVSIFSEGKTLQAIMNYKTDRELMVFTYLVDFDLSKKHMITLTWSSDNLILYFDGKEEYKVSIKDLS